MKKIKKILMFIAVIILLLVIVIFRPTWTQQIKGDNSINVLEQVDVNGENHGIMIRGNNKDNPVILFVHGGPGTSEIPYVADYQDLLESKFTVVHYDQRASGKSFHFSEDYSNLSPELLVDDLLAMTDYIAKRLGKEKVILIGHSYGTYIGMQAVNRAPEKYEAYVGIGQMSEIIKSEIDNLNYVIEQAQSAGDTEDVLYLQGLTEKVENGEMFTPRNYVIKYGGATRLIDNPDGNNLGMLLSSEYNLFDIIRYNYGLIYSQNSLLKNLTENSLPSIVTKLELPCYFVMGKYDYMTSSNAALKYFDMIEANQKEFISFDQSAHYPQFEEKEKFYEWMCETFIK